MSSLANRYDHSNFVPKSEYDSSVNRQNESMMHKVKDVVSKFFQPSFLFTASNNEIDSPKRKRQISIEELDDEQQIETTATTTIKNQIIASKSKYLHQPVRDDESQFTDDDDNNNQDVSSIEQDLKEIEQQKKRQIEQQKKRRRTTNYQQIHTNNRHHENEKTNSTDSISSLSNRRLHCTTSTELNSNERINRIISSTQRFNITSTSNYDPSKSPLFSVDNRKQTETTTITTTNLKSNEFSANYLLATSLTDRPQLSKSNSQQSSATLTNKNRLLSNERKIKKAVEDVAKTGHICVLDVDKQGVKSIRKTNLHPLFIYISPPSYEILEKRLRARKTDDENAIQHRLKESKESMEFSKEPGVYDHIVINDKLDVAYNDLKEILHKDIEAVLQQQKINKNGQK
ncbi:unnamed protein product [Rotaria sp. Silwood1]|nr:unnamed protein product [Rotaria sp. Silwood1]